MRISDDEVRQVARLARLTVSDAELPQLAKEMDALLDFVATLDALATDGIVPTAHAVPLVNALRSDEPRPSLDRDLVMAAAPDSHNGCFRVPKVIE